VVSFAGSMGCRVFANGCFSCAPIVIQITRKDKCRFLIMADGGNWGIDKAPVVQYNGHTSRFSVIKLYHRSGGRRQSSYVAAEGNPALAGDLLSALLFPEKGGGRMHQVQRRLHSNL